jgi:hypothetical protein
MSMDPCRTGTTFLSSSVEGGYGTVLEIRLIYSKKKFMLVKPIILHSRNTKYGKLFT